MFPVITVTLPRRRKMVDTVLSEIAEAIQQDIAEAVKTSGGGVWPQKVFRGGKRGSFKPLKGIEKHIDYIIRGNTLTVLGRRTGKRSGRDFLLAHHQNRASGSIDITPATAKVLFVPISKEADKCRSGKEAYRRSNVRGGSLVEGKIIDGEMHRYDPSGGKDGMGGYTPGMPDFVWLPAVRLPSRRLFNRAEMDKTIKRAARASLTTHGLIKKRASFTLLTDLM